VIRTPNQRLRMFVSLTLDELASERAAAKAAVSQLRLTPVLFESGAVSGVDEQVSCDSVYDAHLVLLMDGLETAAGFVRGERRDVHVAQANSAIPAGGVGRDRHSGRGGEST
jgi:hypothetical protein